MRSQLILIIEDDPVTRELLAAFLGASNYRIQCAANGREALNWLHSTGERPALILLDLRMPVMSGWDFRAEQRADPNLASIPVVILSGGGDREEVVATLNATAYFPKPIDPEALLAVVDRLAVS